MENRRNEREIFKKCNQLKRFFYFLALCSRKTRIGIRPQSQSIKNESYHKHLYHADIRRIPEIASPMQPPSVLICLCERISISNEVPCPISFPREQREVIWTNSFKLGAVVVEVVLIGASAASNYNAPTRSTD